MTAVLSGAACVSAPAGGTLGEGVDLFPRIVSTDSALPPRAANIQLDQPGFAALLLIAPGHSATLLYPADSATNNQLAAGLHRIRFEIPTLLAESDSARLERVRQTQRSAPRTRATARRVTPIPLSTPIYLLLLTSAQPLIYARIVEKTGGVSIPNVDMEALNAVAKAIKGTLTNEPRAWAAHYLPIELRPYP